MLTKYKTLPKEDKITILSLSWRDFKSPKSGGAEVYTHEVLKRLDPGQFRIIHFAPRCSGAVEYEFIDNINYIRRGNTLSVIIYAFLYYWKNFFNIDIVIDQCNTHRFFTPFWVPSRKRVFLIFQLTREIWFINIKNKLAASMGALAENSFLKLYRKDTTVTISESTKQDLLALGFSSKNINILPIGLNFTPWDKNSFLSKTNDPTFIYCGRYVKYKGIEDAVVAFIKFKKEYSRSKLVIVGKKNQDFIDEYLTPLFLENNISFGDTYESDVVLAGFVDEEKKLEIMSQANAVVFPSNREGWGMVVTEAAAVGTPSIVYNSPGTVDAVDFGRAGYLCEKRNANAIFRCMKRIVEEHEEYTSKVNAAHEFSKNYSWSKTATLFAEMVIKITRPNS